MSSTTQTQSNAQLATTWSNVLSFEETVALKEQTDEYGLPIWTKDIKTKDGWYRHHHVNRGEKHTCKCGGKFTHKTFAKHKMTKRCLKHQTSRIIKQLKASKTQDEAHEAVRFVPIEITDSTEGFALEMLWKLKYAVIDNREKATWTYDPNHK